jgi:hypothetical protein
MSSPRAGIALRVELARSGLLNSMMGKSLRKLGRDEQHEQHRSLLTWGRRRFRRGFGSFRIWFRG